MKKLLKQPHLFLIAVIGVIVPRRLRADWREEWEAELRQREQLLTTWDRLDWQNKWDLVRRSSSAFWDALWLQGQRREDEMVQDVRFGWRMLRKNPAFTALAVFTLALGIGANAAIFSIVNALLLRPLPGVSEPQRLVQVGRQYADRENVSDSTYPDFVDYRASNTVMAGLAAGALAAFHITDSGGTDRLEGELVSGDYFDVLGVAAARGRLISVADDRDGAEPVCVISYRLWQRRFGGAESVIGSIVKVDGWPFVVIGIADEPFAGIRIGTVHDIWVPITTVHRTDPEIAARLDRRGTTWLEMFGRLKPDVTLPQARTEFSAIAARLGRLYPDTNRTAGVRLDADLGRPVDLHARLRRFASLPFAVVGLVLLIACANVAGLLLARASTRQREIATRLALGARRIRIVRQLLTESLMLAFAGGVGGVIAGAWLTMWLRSLLPDTFMFLSFDVDFGMDWRVFAFVLAIATATGALFGLVPALHVSRLDVSAAAGGSRGSVDRRRGIRGMLVGGEVAVTVLLLVAAALCVRTLLNAAAIDPGYDTARVLTARIDLGKREYTPDRGLALQRELLARMASMTGIDAAAFAVTLPLNDSRWENPVSRAGDVTGFQTFQNIVSPRYFEAMGIPVLLGRSFTERDDYRATPVAILNQTLAQRMWPDENPLGKRLTFRNRQIEVIGLVREIKGRDLFEAPGPMMYLSLFQYYQPSAVLHLRTARPPQQFIAPLRREVTALDTDLPLYDVKPLGEHVTATLTPQRLLAHLVSAFGLLALLLAGIGLYGLLAYAVTERTAEIGLRMALGAQQSDILRLFVVNGMNLALRGAVVGLAASAVLMPLITGVLYGVSPADPLTMTVVPAVLFAVAMVACYIPARRAAHADPTIALRYE
jgi:predicted permease